MKNCPLLMMLKHVNPECEGSNCEWWVETSESCCIRELSFDLNEIKLWMENLNQTMRENLTDAILSTRR